MVHAFTIIPAKPAFGKFSKKLNQGDVISNKRTNLLYNECERTTKVRSQSELLELNKIRRTTCKDGCDVFPFDKTNLEVNLITKEDLKNVLVLEKNTAPGVPAKIDPALSPIFAYYRVDPENKLVGDNPCGIQKYINYMILDVDALINTVCPDDDSFVEECACDFVEPDEGIIVPVNPIWSYSVSFVENPESGIFSSGDDNETANPNFQEITRLKLNYIDYYGRDVTNFLNNELTVSEQIILAPKVDGEFNEVFYTIESKNSHRK